MKFPKHHLFSLRRQKTNAKVHFALQFQHPKSFQTEEIVGVRQIQTVDWYFRVSLNSAPVSLIQTLRSGLKPK